MLRKSNYTSLDWGSTISAYTIILPKGLRFEFDHMISVIYPEGCSACCLYQRTAENRSPYSPFTEGPWCHKLGDGSCDKTNAIQLSEDLAMVVMEPPVTYMSL